MAAAVLTPTSDTSPGSTLGAYQTLNIYPEYTTSYTSPALPDLVLVPRISPTHQSVKCPLQGTAKISHVIIDQEGGMRWRWGRSGCSLQWRTAATWPGAS